MILCKSVRGEVIEEKDFIRSKEITHGAVFASLSLLFPSIVTGSVRLYHLKIVFPKITQVLQYLFHMEILET